ncbi:MAG: hypothetical protein ABIR08_00620 [Sphingomonas sp.]
MRFSRLSAAAFLAVATLVSPGWADNSAAPRASFRDAESRLRYNVSDDRRTLVIMDDTGGYIGVFDPLFDGDGGREGTITVIRLATPAELANFRHDDTRPYVVLNYSAGGLLVVSTGGTASVRPLHCENTSATIVQKNIACKLDLAKAQERYGDAMTASFLRDGPSTIAPIEVVEPCSGITLYVAADGRTMWAIDKSSKQLWKEDPFERAGLKPYRFRRPLIRTVSPATPVGARCRPGLRPVVYLNYNSSQSGELDASTGEFVFRGQD